jgi:hypothetical protein
VYIAPDGKLRKVSANLQITVSGATATVSVSAVITSYSGTVNVVPPPSGEVTPLNSYLNSLGQTG